MGMRALSRASKIYLKKKKRLRNSFKTRCRKEHFSLKSYYSGMNLYMKVTLFSKRDQITLEQIYKVVHTNNKTKYISQH